MKEAPETQLILRDCGKWKRQLCQHVMRSAESSHWITGSIGTGQVDGKVTMTFRTPFVVNAIFTSKEVIADLAVYLEERYGGFPSKKIRLKKVQP